MQNMIKTFKNIYLQLKEIYTDNPSSIISLIKGFMVVFLIRICLTALDAIFVIDEYPIQRIIFMVSTALLIMGLEIGYTKFIFNIIDGIKVNISEIFNNFDLLGKYIVTTLIFYAILLVGSLPGIFYTLFKYGMEFFDILADVITEPYYGELIDSFLNMNDILIIITLISIPVIYLTIRFCFWSFYIIDKQLDPLVALKASWDLTENQELNIFCYTIFILLINFLGALSIIGLCVTAPLSYLFFCKYYRFLNAK